MEKAHPSYYSFRGFEDEAGKVKVYFASEGSGLDWSMDFANWAVAEAWAGGPIRRLKLDQFGRLI